MLGQHPASCSVTGLPKTPGSSVAPKSLSGGREEGRAQGAKGFRLTPERRQESSQRGCEMQLVLEPVP